RKSFWRRCCKYFNSESDGKTGNDKFNFSGNLISNTIIANINQDPENLLKITKIIKNNIHKLNPSYFSKICGTTGLVVFFIKDLLDFYGLSGDKKTQHKTFNSYQSIVSLLNKKIEKLT